MAYAPSFYVGLNGNWLTLKSDTGNLEHVQAVYLAFPLNAIDDKVAALNLQKWSALGTFSTGIAGATSAPTLKNLANGANKLGSAITLTGASDRQRHLALELKFRMVASTVTGTIDVYMLPAIDGTNYPDGDDTGILPDPALKVAVITPRAVTTQQRVAVLWALAGTTPQAGSPLVVPAFPFKFLVRNGSGAALTNTDNENVLSYRVFTPEAVAP